MYVEKLKPQCISCLKTKHLNSAPDSFSEEQKREYRQGILRIIQEAETHQSAPVVVEKINEFKESIGIISDYSEIKNSFNTYMLSIENDIQGKIESSKNPLKAALLYAIAGNFIDFGALDSVAIEKLNEILKNSQSISISDENFVDFKSEISYAKKITYILDNCGEIVLDKLLIKQIQKVNPNAKIDVIVRGKDVLNDCTIKDAEQAKLTELVSVTDNGTAIAGTCLERISKESKVIIDNADIIISKGQGNFETLSYCGKNIYYLFLCKCNMFAEKFGVEKFTGMFLREKEL